MLCNRYFQLHILHPPLVLSLSLSELALHLLQSLIQPIKDHLILLGLLSNMLLHSVCFHPELVQVLLPLTQHLHGGTSLLLCVYDLIDAALPPRQLAVCAILSHCQQLVKFSLFLGQRVLFLVLLVALACLAYIFREMGRQGVILNVYLD